MNTRIEPVCWAATVSGKLKIRAIRSKPSALGSANRKVSGRTAATTFNLTPEPSDSGTGAYHEATILEFQRLARPSSTTRIVSADAWPCR